MPKTQIKSKTKSITNTKMAIATLALFAGGAAALATVPSFKPNNTFEMCVKYTTDCSRGNKKACNLLRTYCNNKAPRVLPESALPPRTTGGIVGGSSVTGTITPLPDLVITDLRLVPGSAGIKDYFVVSLANIGTVTASSSFVVVVELATSTFSGVYTNILRPGDVGVINISSGIGKVGSPPYHMRGIVDHTDTVLEFFETNNIHSVTQY